MKSPSKALSTIVDESPRAGPSAPEAAGDAQEEEGKEDTSVLLARMKHMVEDAKRRQSMGPRPSLASGMLPTPRKSSGGFSLLAPDADSAPVKQIAVEDEPTDEDEGGDLEEEDVSNRENEDAAPPETQTQELGDEEDVEMAPGDEDTHSEETQPEFKQPYPKSVMETPRMDGLKHMFGAPHLESATPSFQGVREMFNRPTSSATLETPRLEGVRQMFNKPAPGPALETPRLEGVRQMFTRADGDAAAADSSRGRRAHQEVPSTPAFEGVGNMLETPIGYRAVPQYEEELEQEDPAGQDAEEREEQEQTEEEAPAPAPKSRSRKPSTQQKTPGARRTSPRNVPPSEPTIEEPDLPTVDEEETEPPPAARVTRKTRGKAAASDTETEAESSAPRTRRTRKTSASPAHEEPGTATRSTRRARTKTPTPQLEDAPATATRSRRRARTPIAEEDEEEDPLDSIPRTPSPEVPLPEETAAPPRPVRRTARGKFVLEVKEEEDEALPAPGKAAPATEPKTAVRGSAVPRPVRGRRPAGAAAATASSLARTSSIPRSTTAAARGAKTTSTLRRPATVPSMKQSLVESTAAARNKENTADPEDEQDRPAAPRTTSRVARVGTRTVSSRTRAASVDQPDKPAEVGKSRVSRTKTAARK